MYREHFGLTEQPFAITPLTEFFYGGANRGATLEALIYAITHGGGIIKVTGEVGSGKTMLCRVLMERLPAGVETIYLANPSLSREEILHSIADELGLDLGAGHAAAAVRMLQAALIEKYAAGKQMAVLIDEAHAMPAETLEELRLLYNLESSRHKLLQIILFGQTELDEMLALPQMRQLKDRITHHFTMQPFSADAVKEYLMFRLRAAGYRGPNLFSAEAARLIARASGGLTRRLNIYADKSLLAAFIDQTHGIEVRHVRAAIEDFEPRPRPGVRQWANSPQRWLAGVALLLAGAALGAWGWQALGPAPTNSTAPAPLPAAASPQAG